jgi:uncharacterized protein Usg
MNNRDLRKRVDVEQKFADYVLKDFKHKRYGICSSNITEQLEKYIIKKELYSWKDLDLKKHYPYLESEIEYCKDNWEPGDSCKPWMTHTCNNGCPKPQVFIPNAKQLNNNDCGEGPLGSGYNSGGGINISRTLFFKPLYHFPVKSGEGQVTFYYTVDPVGFINEWQDHPDYDPSNSPDPNGPVYKIPIAQFYLKPYPEGHPKAGTIGAWFKYNDPNMRFYIESSEDFYDDETGLYDPTEGYGTVGLTEYTDENGDVWYIDYNHFSTAPSEGATGENREALIVALTLFGNTNKDYNSFKLNGGEANGPRPITVVYVDGDNIYDLKYSSEIDENNNYEELPTPESVLDDADIFSGTYMPSWSIGVTDIDSIFWSGCGPQANWGLMGAEKSILQRTCSYDCAQGTTFYEPSYTATLDSGDNFVTGVYSDEGTSVSNTPCLLEGFTIIPNASEVETFQPGPLLIYGNWSSFDPLNENENYTFEFISHGPIPVDCNPSDIDTNSTCCCPEGTNLIFLTSAGGQDISCEQIPAPVTTCLGYQTTLDMIHPMLGCVAPNQTCSNGQWVSTEIEITPYPEVSCVEDIETLFIEVVNQNGTPIPNYEIILDGGNFGFTDEFGRFKTTIENASVNTNHTINVCYCFETTGWCSQKYIKLVITDNNIIDTTVSKAECNNISKCE